MEFAFNGVADFSQMGAGFVVAHLPNGEWSGPAFFQWHGELSFEADPLPVKMHCQNGQLRDPTGCCVGVGGGITFGVSKADTVIILNTERALAQYQSRDMNFKFGESTGHVDTCHGAHCMSMLCYPGLVDIMM